jgi:bacterioferritin-associated ferredoxin
VSVTEAALVDALTSREIKTLKDIRRLTGAGDGCTACHKLLKTYLEGMVLATIVDPENWTTS